MNQQSDSTDLLGGYAPTLSCLLYLIFSCACNEDISYMHPLFQLTRIIGKKFNSNFAARESIWVPSSPCSDAVKPIPLSIMFVVFAFHVLGLSRLILNLRWHRSRMILSLYFALHLIVRRMPRSSGIFRYNILRRSRSSSTRDSNIIFITYHNS